MKQTPNNLYATKQILPHFSEFLNWGLNMNICKARVVSRTSTTTINFVKEVWVHFGTPTKEVGEIFKLSHTSSLSHKNVNVRKKMIVIKG
jgi:hypothetical protein